MVRRVKSVNGAGRRMRLGLLVAVGAAAPLEEVKVLKTRGGVPRCLGTGLEDGLCGGAAGRPLIGFRPSSAAEEGTYGAKTVDVATTLVTTVCLTVTVFWRGMMPATAGPARRAEIKMLESMSFGCCWWCWGGERWEVGEVEGESWAGRGGGARAVGAERAHFVCVLYVVVSEIAMVVVVVVVVVEMFK